MGGRLVMVGSQDARTQALIGEDWDPLQVSVAWNSKIRPDTYFGTIEFLNLLGLGWGSTCNVLD